MKKGDIVIINEKEYTINRLFLDHECYECHKNDPCVQLYPVGDGKRINGRKNQCCGSSYNITWISQSELLMYINVTNVDPNAIIDLMS